MYQSSRFIFIVAIGLFVGVCSVVIYLGTRRTPNPPTFTVDETKIEIPTEIDKEPEIIPQPTSELMPPSAALLDVPFYPQAPFGRWDALHKETCEEASMMMVYTFKKRLPKLSIEELDKKLINFVEWQTLSGYSYDLTVRQLQEATSSYINFDGSEVIKNPTVKDIEREIASGNPVIVPAAGRLLPNPYFTPPGPRYHMLVLIGYNEDEFITNDPGTRRGEKFKYQKKDLMNAIHDYSAGDITTGSRNVLVYR